MATIINNLLSDFQANHSNKVQTARDFAGRLLQASRRIQRSWSGSFAGWHGTMYFRDFSPPSVYERFSGEWGGVNGIPDGWEERQPEIVQAKIEELVGSSFSIEQFEDTLRRLRKAADILKEDIILNVDPKVIEALSAREKDLVGRVEEFDFGKTTGQFVTESLPKTLVSRDSEALRQGTCVPAWLYYEGIGLEAQTLCETIEAFFQLTDRLVVAMEKDQIGDVMKSGAGPFDTLHREIRNKCQELYEKKVYPEAVEKASRLCAIGLDS